MSAIIKTLNACSIMERIEQHSAWLGSISGLKAEKMLRGKKQPYLYVLRAGENQSATEGDYYVTYVDADLIVRHQPFIISMDLEGWSFINGSPGGPYTDATTIDDVLPIIMHCDECYPLV